MGSWNLRRARKNICIRYLLLVLIPLSFYVARPGLHFECSVNKLRITPKKFVKSPFKLLVRPAMKCKNNDTIWSLLHLPTFSPSSDAWHHETDPSFFAERVFECFPIFIRVL